MEIGCFGDVVFEVSSYEVKTINSFSWTTSAVYSTHAVVNEVGVMEYTGTNPDKISFKMFISEYLGSDPMSEFETIRDYVREHEDNVFVLGDNVIGDSWVATQAQLTAKHFDRNGNVTSIEVSVTLEEYV